MALVRHITAAQDGEKIDRAILSFDLGWSRRQIRRLLDGGGVRVGDRRIRLASYRVKQGETLHLEEPLRAAEAPPKLTRKDILWRGEGLIAISKPPGLSSQPPGGVEEALSRLGTALGWPAGKGYYLCHRLDRETSGVLVVATSRPSATAAGEAFRDHSVQKEYLALVCGHPARDRWEVRCYLSPLKGRTGEVEVVKAGGKPSHTRFEVLARSDSWPLSLVRCHPTTGRSHQLRVHLAQGGNPILGDKRYGGPFALPPEILELARKHHMLHAHRLSLPLPSGETARLTAPLPQTMLATLEATGLSLG